MGQINLNGNWPAEEQHSDSSKRWLAVCCKVAGKLGAVWKIQYSALQGCAEVWNVLCSVYSVHIIQCILCVLYIIQCILCAVCIARCGCFVGSLSWLRFDHPVTPVTWLRVAAVTKIPNHPPPILSTSRTKTEVIGLPGGSWVGSGGLTHGT